MAGLRGLFVQRDGSNNGTTPKGARLALGGLLAPSTTDPLSVRTGVLVDGMQAVVSGTGSMAYQVRGFVGVTKFTDANGPVLAANDAPVSVATTPSPGANSRIDRVWMIQRLVTGDGGSGTVNVFEFGVTQGNVAASPTAPTGIPAGAEPLYDFTVTAGATSTAGLTGVRRHAWTVGNGGIVPTGPRRGQFWDGAGWRNVVAEDSGTITVANVWAPDPPRPLRWTRQGSLVFLAGSMFYNEAIPNTGQVTLSGIPPVATRWDGVLRSGISGIAMAGLNTDTNLLIWSGRLGSNSAGLALDGIYYDTTS